MLLPRRYVATLNIDLSVYSDMLPGCSPWMPCSAAGNVMFRARDQNIAPPTGFALRWIVTGEGGGVATICE